MSRFKGKPVGGLPSALPKGETLLWQGAPEWRSLARRAFRIRWAAGYFGALITWRVGEALVAGQGVRAALTAGASSLTLAGVSLGIFAGISWLMSRTTTYTITDKRVVITYGMALPKSVNLPYNRIDAADLALHAERTGDIALKLPSATRLSYLLLWPHVRAGANGRAEPVLRCIASPQAAAELLVNGLSQSMAATERATVTSTPTEAPVFAAAELSKMRAQAA
jgi:hypothetical protein